MKQLAGLVDLKNRSFPFRVLLHLGFWLAYWLISYYFNTISTNLFSATPLVWIEPLGNMLNLVLFYYPFMYYLWPAHFRKKRYLSGVIILAIQVLLFTFLYELQERLMISNCPACQEILLQIPTLTKQYTEQSVGSGMLGSLMSLGIFYVLIARLSPVLAIKFSLDYIRERTMAMELEKENILLEFNFLRSQVNPHFLFNTLNNIQSLILQDRKQDAGKTLGRLSDFLRHSLYETNGENVSLDKEVKLIGDYVELEKLRLNKTRVELDLGLEGFQMSIPPLLFIPVVENAFKYNADNLPGTSFIEVVLVLNERLLSFRVRNSYDPAKRKNSGGIGLVNLRKRLASHYPSRNEVRISDRDNIYDITINIER